MGWTLQASMNQKRRRAALKAKGICVDCTDYKAAPERVLCSTCLARRIFRYKGTLNPVECKAYKPYKRSRKKKKVTVEMKMAKVEQIIKLGRNWYARNRKVAA